MMLYNLPTKLKLASKLDREQFMVLRIFWKKEKTFVAGEWGITDLSDARNLLNGLAHWKKYLEYVPQSLDSKEGVPEELGTFA